ncbi:MAG: type II secretion system F family protein [Alphaproteobacteria bacterium]
MAETGGIDNMTLVVVGLVAATALVLIGLLVYAAFRVQSGTRYQKRVAMVSGSGARDRAGGKQDPTATRRRAVQQRLKEMEEQRKRTRKSASLRTDLQQAGLRTNTRMFFLVSFFVGIVCVAIYLYFDMPWQGAIPVFLVGLFGLPRFYVKRRGKKRRGRFTHHFADAVDVIVRGVQSGLPVNECLNIIARESPEPVGSEFRQITEGIKVGLTLNETMTRSLERMPTAELKFFAVVLSIQQQTGGNLAETLGNLSGVLRDRKRMADKIQAMTSEARMTAMIIGSLPFCMTAILALAAPDYIGLLFVDPIGHFLIGAGITSMSLGIFIMQRMIAFEY